jgi:hypothetical protein
MRGYFTMSEDEKNSILQQHSGFYNGYSTGNVPSEPQPLRVDKGPTDTQGITVNNRGEVKTYRNHLVNEQKVKKETKEIEDLDTNYSEVDPSFDFKSDGPEQFEPDMDDKDPYDLDIDAIQKMFDYEDIDGGDSTGEDMMSLEDKMDSEFSGKEMMSNEKPAYNFKSDGGDVDVFGEEEQCEGCGESEIDEIDVSDLKKGKKYKYETPSLKDDIEFKDKSPESSMYGFKGKDVVYSLNQKAVEDLIKQIKNDDEDFEMDDEIFESFSKEKDRIIKMFNRFKKFN